jgi:hypothetical protein
LTEEAAGDFADAMADLKVYQQFKLSDTEARSVQDRIYALEAKQLKKASDDSAKMAADAEEAKYGWLQGEWSYTSTYPTEGPSWPPNSGVTQTRRTRNSIEFSSIKENLPDGGELLATVNESGDVSWTFHIDDNVGCPLANPTPVTATVSKDRRVIKFEIGYRSGGGCQYSHPMDVTLTHK